MKYIHERENWADFSWDWQTIAPILARVHQKEGVLLGKLSFMDDSAQAELMLGAISDELQKSYEIEGEKLDIAKVRSSFANRLNISIKDKVYSGKDIDNFTNILLDAVKNHSAKLTKKRLLGWHKKMFANGKSGLYKISAGEYRKTEMQVISGAFGREKVHYQAPAASTVNKEMRNFLRYVNENNEPDSIIKAAIAHLRFVSVHPFDDGNGRLARIITEMLLARGLSSPHRFYSISAQIMKARNAYYDTLERTQKGNGDITEWIAWFLLCMEKSVAAAEDTVNNILRKTLFWQKHSDVSFNSRQREMLNRLFGGFEGKLTSSKWAKINKCSIDTALRDINGLMAKKILTQDSGSGKNTGYTLVVG